MPVKRPELKQRLNALIALPLSFIPSPLPLTEAEHERWSEAVLKLGGFPANNDSLKHAIAALLMHLPERCTRKPKQYFIAAIRKSIINQVAYNMMQDIKERDKAARDQKSISEATTAVV